MLMQHIDVGLQTSFWIMSIDVRTDL